MRISILPGDPGFATLKGLREGGKTPQVWLDGERVEHCITADDEYGFVIHAARDDAGDPLDWKECKHRRRQTGRVEIVTD